MANVTEQKCASCGAPLYFDPESGRLVCRNCGAALEIEKEPKAEDISLEGLDFDALAAQAADESAEKVPIYHCVSCGAEIIAPAEQIATTCPYCGNNVVLTDKVSGKLRPDGVVPFHIDAKSLPHAMNEFYRGKALLPRNFFSENTMSRVTGVYVPFWLFNGHLSGTLRFHGEQSSSHRQGDYVITETKHYQLTRKVDLSFADVPVDASGRIADELTDSLEPFDLSDARPFDMRYLAGFTADRFDQAKDDMARRAERRMVSSAESAAADTVHGYGGVTRTGGELRAQLSARYLLLPVYLFSIRHEGKDYSFAVNGQTGKVVGELPISKSVSTRYFLLRMGAAAAAVVAAFVAKYMLGA